MYFVPKYGLSRTLPTRTRSLVCTRAITEDSKILSSSDFGTRHREGALPIAA